MGRWYPNKDNTDSPFDKIMLLRIAPSSSFDGLFPEKKSPLINGTRWLAGPLEAIVNVRSASQAERGNLETDLAALYLTKSQDAVADPDARQEVRAMARPSFESGRKTAAEAAALRKFQYRKTGKSRKLRNRNSKAQRPKHQHLSQAGTSKTIPPLCQLEQPPELH